MGDGRGVGSGPKHMTLEGGVGLEAWGLGGGEGGQGGWGWLGRGDTAMGTGGDGRQKGAKHGVPDGTGL